MTNIDTASRAELEIAILEHDLEDTLFGGIDNILIMSTDKIREILGAWVEEGNETE